jgi:hypothetical protein
MKYTIITAASKDELITAVDDYLTANSTFLASGNPIWSQTIGWMQVVTVNVANPTVYSVKGNEVRGVTDSIVNLNATDVLPAAGVGLYNKITSILVTNGHATVGTYVNIIEETSGDIIATGYAAAGGGGFVVNPPTPLKQLTTNKKIQAQCETTGSNVRVCISGFKEA